MPDNKRPLKVFPSTDSGQAYAVPALEQVMREIESLMLQD